MPACRCNADAIGFGIVVAPRMGYNGAGCRSSGLSGGVFSSYQPTRCAISICDGAFATHATLLFNSIPSVLETACAGIKRNNVYASRTHLLDCAELAADTAEQILKTTTQHSASSAAAGDIDGLRAEVGTVAALRNHLQQLQVRLRCLTLPSATYATALHRCTARCRQDVAASAKPYDAALPAVWDNLTADRTATALAMLRAIARDT